MQGAADTPLSDAGPAGLHIYMWAR